MEFWEHGYGFLTRRRNRHSHPRAALIKDALLQCRVGQIEDAVQGIRQVTGICLRGRLRKKKKNKAPEELFKSAAPVACVKKQLHPVAGLRKLNDTDSPKDSDAKVGELLLVVTDVGPEPGFPLYQGEGLSFLSNNGPETPFSTMNPSVEPENEHSSAAFPGKRLFARGGIPERLPTKPSIHRSACDSATLENPQPERFWKNELPTN